MWVYLRTNFQVCSILLKSFRQAAEVILSPPPHTHTPQNEPIKSPPRLGLKVSLNKTEAKNLH